MDSATTIHLLTITESSHDAEVIASLLRNAGYAIRAKHLDSLNQLDAVLKSESWEMVICDNNVKTTPASTVLERIAHSGKDVPCLVYGGIPDRKTILELTRLGAANVIPKDEQEYFSLCIAKELKSLHGRRSFRELRNTLNESEKQIRTLMDSSREPICYIHEGMHIYTNYSYTQIFGYEDSEEMESVPIMDLISTGQQKNFKELLRSISKGKIPEKDFEFKAVRSDGKEFDAQMCFSTSSIDGESCTQVIIRQESNNAELERELDQLRKQDLLTGLYNRQFFMEELAAAIQKASSGKATSVLFYIEPENFKTIKDTLGIAGSDIVLTDIANLLKQTLPGNILLARFAGTIFTALFPNITTDDVLLMAEQVLDTFTEKLFEVDNKTVTTTCSIGIIQITENSADAKTVLSQADAASILAKEKKDKHLHIHTIADELASLEQDKAWADRIRVSLKENKFVLHYQPIVSLHAEPGERYEVLIRMLDSENKIIMPKDFMEAAEHSGLMTEIDRWVMKNSAKALLEKRRDGTEIRFFIKLSFDSLSDPTLLPWISKLLKAARLHGSAFVFEVSESVACNNIKITKQLVNGLKQLNCLFAVDHVGHESDNLHYLSHFQVNYLKIDGQHIQGLTSSETSQQLVKSITEIARTKEILTIAEHVQDPACLAILWQHGVNFIQGHYLQHPEGNLDYDFTADAD